MSLTKLRKIKKGIGWKGSFKSALKHRFFNINICDKWKSIWSLKMFHLEYVGTYSISLLSENSIFKHKISTRVGQRKSKSSLKEYIRRTCLKLWPTKAFSEIYKPMRVRLWFVYKIAKNNCPSQLFAKFI